MAQPVTHTPPKGTPPTSNTSDQMPLSPFSRNIIQTLGYMRVVLGAGALIAPLTVGKLFQIPLNSSNAIVAEMAGVRDIAIGELTVLADKEDKEMKELRRVLWANVAIDTVDVVACGFSFAMGTMTRIGAMMFGGGAVTFLALGVAGLRSL